MKILTIGDLHGLNVWENKDFSNYDLVIFEGDYVDSFDKTDLEIYNNLMNLIEFKKSNMKKVILLLGNHDMQYMYHPRYRCTGFRSLMLFNLYQFFNDNRNLFQISYQYKNYVWTHAGITNAWLKHFYNDANSAIFEKNNDSIADDLNLCRDSRYMNILMEIGIERGGSNIVGGPLWADSSELLDDYLDNIHQVAGHNPQKEIWSYRDDSSSITFVDCLQHKIEYFELENEK